MHKKEAFQCDFCYRCFARPVDAANHEVACKYNPARRSCYTCKHMDKNSVISTTFLFSEGVGEHIDITGMVCTHFNLPVGDKPYFIECETKEGFYGEIINIPGTCLCYEQKEDAQ